MKAIQFRFFYFLLATAIVFNFTSCDKDNDDNGGGSKETVTIDFEDVTLNAEGYWNGSDLSGDPRQEELYGSDVTNYYGSFKSGIAYFENKYTEDWFSWTGFACSSLNDKETATYGNQYSVYVDSNGTNKFAVAYADGNPAIFKFEDNKEKEIKSVQVANSTWTYLSVKNGDDMATAFEPGDWLKVTFTGYDNANKKTNIREFYLADYRNGKNYICEEWTNVDLAPLGKVNRIEVSVLSSDDGKFIPAYACLDNLVYIK